MSPLAAVTSLVAIIGKYFTLRTFSTFLIFQHFVYSCIRLQGGIAFAFYVTYKSNVPNEQLEAFNEAEKQLKDESAEIHNLLKKKKK